MPEIFLLEPNRIGDVMREDDQTSGEMLRRFRHRSGRTQKDLAEILNIPRSTLDNYERGTAKLPVRILKQLEEIGFGKQNAPEVGKILGVVGVPRVPLPFIGSVNASAEMSWDNPLDADVTEDVPAEMAGENRFCCRVASDSCYDLLWPGDLAVLEKSSEIRERKIILFRTEDRRVTLKQVRRSGSNYILHPLNSRYEDVLAEGEQVGFLVGIVRTSGTRSLTIFDPKGIED